MNKPLITTAVLVVLTVCGTALGFSDDFDSYATGPLSIVSAGVWNTWGGASTDALVTAQGLSLPNAQYHDGIGLPDVVTYWDDLFGGGGGGRLSFDFLVHEEGEDDIETYLTVGSGDPVNLDVNFDTMIGIFIIDFGGSLGTTSLHIWDVDLVNGGGDYGLPLLGGGLALDVWHHVDLLAALTVADPTANNPLDEDGLFEVWLNGGLALGPTSFGLDDPFGWNATDIYSFPSVTALPEENDYTLLDNFEAIPEPGIVLLGGLVLLALGRRRN